MARETNTHGVARAAQRSSLSSGLFLAVPTGAKQSRVSNWGQTNGLRVPIAWPRPLKTPEAARAVQGAMDIARGV